MSHRREDTPRDLEDRLPDPGMPERVGSYGEVIAVALFGIMVLLFILGVI